MFKFKLSTFTLSEIETRLKINNDETSSIVITDNPSLIEEDKLNIVFKEKSLEALEELVDSLKNLGYTNITFTTNKGVLKLKTKDIYYIQTYGDDIILYTKDNNFILKTTLYQLEQELDKYNFTRIGKATIVNVAKIIEIETGFNAKLNLILDNKVTLEVTRSYVKGFKEYLKK